MPFVDTIHVLLHNNQDLPKVNRIRFHVGGLTPCVLISVITAIADTECIRNRYNSISHRTFALGFHRLLW